MTSGFNINPDEVHGGANSLGSFADEASSHVDRLSQTSERVSAHTRGDRSGVGKAIETGVSKATTVMTDTAKQIIRVVKGSAQRLHTGTDAHVENETKQKGVLDKIHPKDEKVTAHPDKEGGSSSTSTSSAHTPHEPPKPKGEGESATPPLHDANKPPSATDNHSEQFKKQPNLPTPEPFGKELPTSDKNSYGVPPDKARGAKVTQLSEDDVTRDKDGLITHVKGQPVKDYINDLSKKKAEDASDPSAIWKQDHPNAKKVPSSVPGKEKVCSAVAIDRRTGLVTHGVNGKATDVIPDKNLHPLLQQNLQNLRGWEHGIHKEDGTVETMDGRAHPSIPANHAEVKAVNELLWDRQSKLGPGQTLGPDTMKEIGFDPRWTKQTGYGDLLGEAPACANCNTILHGAESYTGRYQHAPLDVRYQSTKLPH
ncbi:MAG TPA: YwqJ-related putative deaminase [Pseudonocardiaceae bacterium]|nr:YwqJ-related putative deaminase [Pseudonocardiaceae bacterium]